MASGINIYSQIMISLIRISDDITKIVEISTCNKSKLHRKTAHSLYTFV